MSGWIKWEKDLETDPRFVRLVRQVRKSVTGVTQVRDIPAAGDMITSLAAGCLLRFWVYADTHVRADDTLDLGVEDIDELVGLPGFAAGLPDDWLVEIDNNRVQLPDFQKHNGIAAKKKALDQKRQERRRVTQQRDEGVTPVTQVRDQTRPRPDQKSKKSSPIGEPKENGSRRARPACRLPADFDLTAERRAYAQERGLDAIKTFENFTDYWRAASGAKASKCDWDATWRLWCRREADSDGKIGRRSGKGGKFEQHDEKLKQWAGE